MIDSETVGEEWHHIGTAHPLETFEATTEELPLRRQIDSHQTDGVLFRLFLTRTKRRSGAAEGSRGHVSCPHLHP